MFGSIKNYIQDQIALVKLEGVEAIGRVAAQVAFLVLVGLFIMIFIILLSFGGAFYLGELLDNRVHGFLIMAGVYLVLIILFILLKRPLQNFVTNIAIAATMNTNKDEEKD